LLNQFVYWCHSGVFKRTVDHYTQGGSHVFATFFAMNADGMKV